MKLWVPVLLPLFLWLMAMLVGLLALIDIARRPERQFTAAGQSHTSWLVIAVVSIFVPCPASLGAGYYLLAIRPKLPPPGRA